MPGRVVIEKLRKAIENEGRAARIEGPQLIAERLTDWKSRTNALEDL